MNINIQIDELSNPIQENQPLNLNSLITDIIESDQRIKDVFHDKMESLFESVKLDKMQITDSFKKNIDNLFKKVDSKELINNKISFIFDNIKVDSKLINESISKLFQIKTNEPFITSLFKRIEKNLQQDITKGLNLDKIAILFQGIEKNISNTLVKSLNVDKITAIVEQFKTDLTNKITNNLNLDRFLIVFEKFGENIMSNISKTIAKEKILDNKSDSNVSEPTAQDTITKEKDVSVFEPKPTKVILVDIEDDAYKKLLSAFGNMNTIAQAAKPEEGKGGLWDLIKGAIGDFLWNALAFGLSALLAKLLAEFLLKSPLAEFWKMVIKSFTSAKYFEAVVDMFSKGFYKIIDAIKESRLFKWTSEKMADLGKRFDNLIDAFKNSDFYKYFDEKIVKLLDKFKELKLAITESKPFKFLMEGIDKVKNLFKGIYDFFKADNFLHFFKGAEEVTQGATTGSRYIRGMGSMTEIFRTFKNVIANTPLGKIFKVVFGPGVKLAKGALKFIPIFGDILSLWFGYERIKEGGALNVVQGFMDIISGILGLTGIGTPVSLALDGINLLIDLCKWGYEEGTTAVQAKGYKGIWDFIVQKMKKVMSEIYQTMIKWIYSLMPGTMKYFFKVNPSTNELEFTGASGLKDLIDDKTGGLLSKTGESVTYLLGGSPVYQESVNLDKANLKKLHVVQYKIMQELDSLNKKYQINPDKGENLYDKLESLQTDEAKKDLERVKIINKAYSDSVRVVGQLSLDYKDSNIPEAARQEAYNEVYGTNFAVPQQKKGIIPESSQINTSDNVVSISYNGKIIQQAQLNSSDRLESIGDTSVFSKEGGTLDKSFKDMNKVLNKQLTELTNMKNYFLDMLSQMTELNMKIPEDGLATAGIPAGGLPKSSDARAPISGARDAIYEYRQKLRR